MNCKPGNPLADVAPIIREHLMDHVHAAVATAEKAFALDEYNDGWVYGCVFWRNLWLRLERAAEAPDCPFEVSSDGDKYCLTLGDLTIRHHRVDPVTLIPLSGQTVKRAALVAQMRFEAFDIVAPSPTNAVLAIVAQPTKGLREVFLGVLVKEDYSYEWEQRVPVYGVDAASEEPLSPEPLPAVAPVDAERDVEVVVYRAQRKEAARAKDGND